MTSQDLSPPRLHKLAEVAQQTGIPLKRLQNGCRTEQIRHTNFGGRRYMTDEHIAELISKHTVGGGQEPPADPDDADRARVARMAASAA